MYIHAHFSPQQKCKACVFELLGFEVMKMHSYHTKKGLVDVFDLRLKIMFVCFCIHILQTIDYFNYVALMIPKFI